YAVDGPKARLRRNLTQTLVVLGRGHGLFSSLVPADVGVASACARTATNISRRINPLNGRINVQYARNRRRVTASAHNTRVSVHVWGLRVETRRAAKFHAALAVPGGAGSRKRCGSVG